MLLCVDLLFLAFVPSGRASKTISLLACHRETLFCLSFLWLLHKKGAVWLCSPVMCSCVSSHRRQIKHDVSLRTCLYRSIQRCEKLVSRLNSCFGTRASSPRKLLILLSQERTAGVDADCWTMGLHFGYAQTRRTKGT